MHLFGAAFTVHCVDHPDGEQAHYLRFMPVKPKSIRFRWWGSLAGGPIESSRLAIEMGPRRLAFGLHQQTGDGEAGVAGSVEGEWLIVMRETSEEAVIEVMRLTLKWTAREAEVLYWLVKGKISSDIGEILGASPETVKKHLERPYIKLGVETRTVAAGMAMSLSRMCQRPPSFRAEQP